MKVENIVHDNDGSIRFQLSHSGPLSRQVFANVRRVEQSNGLTRSIITNIADGHQTEYLTRTDGKFPSKKFGSTDDGFMLAQSGGGDDQNTQCPWCYVLGVVVTEVVCAVTTSLAHYQCRLDCQNRGGVLSFESGVCGTSFSECTCWHEPRRVFDKF